MISRRDWKGWQLAVVLALIAAPLPCFAAGAAPIHGQAEFSPQQIEWGSFEEYSTVRIPGFTDGGAIGYPELPERSLYYLLPDGYDVAELLVDRQESRVEETVGRLLPARAPDWREAGIAESPEVYEGEQDLQYPARPVELVGVGTWHGRRIAEVLYHPVAWRPGLRQVVYTTSVEFTLTLRPLTESAAPARALRADREDEARVEREIASRVENPPALSAAARSGGTAAATFTTFRPTDYPSLDGSRVEYVIITTDALQADFQSFADWKTQTGTPAVVRTTSWIESNVSGGSDVADKIRRFIRDAYQKWGTSYVLLGGDTDVIPPRYIHTSYYFTHGGEDIPTDLYYAALDGNWDADGDGRFGEGYVYSPMQPGDSVDLYPEVFVGRAPVATSAETQIFIDKTERYRTSPIAGTQTTAAFLAEVLFPVGWSYPDTESILTNGCDLAYDVVSYITDPAWDTLLVCEYPHGTMSQTSVKAALNQGYGLLSVITHGDPFKISSSDGKYVRIDDFQALTNDNEFSIYYFSNCNTSQYDSECLNEAAILNPHGGSVASIAPARLEFPLVSDDYMKEFYRIFFQTDVERLGEMSELHRLPFIASVQMDNSRRWVHFAQLLLGDPGLVPWKTEPSDLVLTHAGSMTVSDSVYTVTATDGGSPVEGVLVVLWDSATGDYARGATDAAGEVALPYRPGAAGTVKLTALHRDYRTRQDSVVVGAGSTARLRVAGVVIDDDSAGLSSGNGNGVAEAGERIELGVTLANTGASDATGVNADLILGAGASLTLDVQQDGSSQANRVWLGARRVNPGAIPVTIGLDGDTLSVWGRPLYTQAVAADSGAYFWQDLGGWHLRFVSGGQPQAFAGSLSTDGAVRSAVAAGLEPGDSFTAGSNLLTFSVSVDSTDFEDGIDLVLDDSSSVSLLVPAASFGDISAGDSATAYFLVESDPSTTDLHQSRMDVSVSGATLGSLTWPEGVRFEVASPVLVEEYHDIDDSAGNGDGFLDLGETVGIIPQVRNVGHGTATGVQGILRALSGITVLDSTATFGDLTPEAIVTASGGFQVMVTAASGRAAELELTDSDGRSWTETYELEVPAAPTNLSPYAVSPQIPGGIDLRWTRSTAPDVWGYNVYRSSGGGPYARINGASIETNAYYLDLAVLPESTYTYQVTAVDSAGNQSPLSNAQSGTVRPPFQAGWPRSTEGFIWASPVVMDLGEDGSGDFEVIVGSQDGYLYVWDAAGNAMPGWPKLLGDEIWASPAVGNFDPSDDELEIVVGCNNKKLYAFNHDGTGLINPDGTFYTSTAQIRSTPTLADLDGDGDLEVIFGNSSGRVYAFNHDGSPYMGAAIFAAPGGGGSVVASVTVADLDGNGDLEVLFPQLNTGKVYAYNHDKTGYLDSTGVFALIPASVWASLAVGDINDNGVMDVVCATWGGRIYAWNKNGVSLPGWPRSTNGAQIWASPALGDMNGDGDLEVVVGSSNDSLYVLQPDGSNLTGWPRALPDSSWSSPCLGDITGDGRPEVILAGMDGYIHAYQWDGTVAPGWPIPTTERTYGSGPTVADLDGDGDVEVLAGTYDGRMYVWDVGKPWDPSPSATPWPTFAHDTHRTGWFDQPFTDVAEGVTSLVPVRFGLDQNVPNPFNPRTVIRYRLAGEAPVLLTIYDVRGRLVRRLVSERQPAGVYEITWTGRDEGGKETASGVYFYRLEAGANTFSRKMVLLR